MICNWDYNPRTQQLDMMSTCVKLATS